MQGSSILCVYTALLFRIVHASLKFDVTAIGAENGSSMFECWQLDKGIDISTSERPYTVGCPVGWLDDVDNITAMAAPAHWDVGLSHPQHNQWVIFLSGLAHITLPDDETTSLTVTGGEFGIVFASDTQDVSFRGHRTQIPTKDGKIPAHTVLHSGPCSPDALFGFRRKAVEVSEGQARRQSTACRNHGGIGHYPK